MRRNSGMLGKYIFYVIIYAYTYRYFYASVYLYFIAGLKIDLDLIF